MLLPILGLVAQLQGAATPFEIGVWPGEGIPVLEVRDTILLLRASPSDDAPVTHRARLTTRTRLTATAGLTRTLEPGLVRARVAAELAGSSYGVVRALSNDAYYSSGRAWRDTLAVGDTVTVLGNRAEGHCLLRVGGAVIEGFSCPDADDRFESLRPTRVEWWVRVRAPGGSVGWVRVDDRMIVEVDREFGAGGLLVALLHVAQRDDEGVERRGQRHRVAAGTTSSSPACWRRPDAAPARSPCPTRPS